MWLAFSTPQRTEGPGDPRVIPPDDLHTSIAAPASGAEWSHVENGKITMVGAGMARGDAPVDVVVGGVPAADADPHRPAAAPVGRPAPAGSFALDRSNDRVGARRIAERHDHLVEHDIVQYGIARFPHPGGEPAGQPSLPVDQLSHAISAEGGERRPL